ncbi:MAG: 5-bromo-4-chloroindolyl phosphate hydrolysis family protein [Oscillospiraceae bacterium]|nr:5-bromo-4-chloroindolyl phosphate hydrolysis family protein [Oscillospiraceae bacterium]
MKINRLNYRSPSASLTIAVLQIVLGSFLSIMFVISFAVTRFLEGQAWWSGSFSSLFAMAALVVSALILCQGIWGCVVYEKYRKLARVVMARSAAVTVKQLSEELHRTPSDVFSDISATINSRYWSGYGITESTLVLADGKKNSGTVISGPDVTLRKSSRRSRAGFVFFAAVFVPYMLVFGGPSLRPQFVIAGVLAVLAFVISTAILPKKIVISRHTAEHKPYKPEPVKTGVEETDSLLTDGLKQMGGLIELEKDIGDEKLAGPVSELLSITRQIFDYVKKHPDKAKQIRQFVGYYLPTTTKLLRNYMELNRQAVKGENIIESMKKIEGIMDGILFTFRQQLNDLYRDKNIDIAADVAVMEGMINRAEPE